MVLGCPGGCWFTVALMNVLTNSFAFSLGESWQNIHGKSWMME